MIKEKIKAGYKSSPLGMIPKDWEVKKLKDVSNIKGGFAFDSKKYLSSGKYQIIKMSNLYYNELDLTRSASFLNSLSDQESDMLLKSGDIIITLTGTIGKKDYGYSYLINSESNLLLNQRVAKIESIGVEPRYLNYQLKTPHFLNQFFYEARGGTGNQANVGTNDLASLRVMIPSFKEQEIIANLLNTWDDAIQNTTQLITQKEQRKKWLMQQLLTGKKRLKGFEKEKWKWKVLTLGDLFERVTKKNTERNQTVVTISAQRGFVMQNDYFNKIIASDILDNYFLVEKGEFCYNKSYSNGYPWGATKRLNDFEKAVVTTLYICFKIKDTNKTSGDYFEHFFEVNSLDKGLMSVANEGGRAHGLLNVTATDFFNIEIKVPKVEEQEAISKILSLSVNEIQLLQNKLNHLKEQKKGLMQVLLTGKKRLKVIK